MMDDIEHKKRLEIKPIWFIFLAFILVILIGSICLYLPFNHNKGVSISYLDALFTSVSATCVTGLVSIKEGIASTFNIGGRIVIIILVQIGGLGAATLAMSFILIISSSLSYSQQALVKESWNISTFKGLKKIFLYNILITLIVEFIGFILIYIDLMCLHSELGNWYELLGHSIFLAISIFNNAGFDLFGTFSFISFSSDYFLLTIFSILIILGGIGYLVIIDLITKKFKWKKLNLHSKVVLFMSLILIILGWISIYLSENIPYFINNNLNKGMGAFDSLFISISSRTGGLTTFSIKDINASTFILLNLFMFIGASPGGTGGGIKTTTIFALILHFRSQIDGKKPHAFRRSVDEETIKKAYLLFLTSIIILILGYILIYAFEGKTLTINDITYSSLDYSLEIFSAFSTTGLSSGITPYLKLGSKIVLMILMFIGRLGPMSISLSLWQKNNKNRWNYVSDSLPIG